MTKFMVLLCAMLTGSACPQQNQPASTILQETLYPYRDKSGRFGYADENLHLQIEPQYKSASCFTEQGFAVITDSLDRKGVINKNNNLIIAAEYDVIQLYPLENFTLAEVHKSFHTRGRFWEWKFLPGFNLTGGGNDNRLFDTKVKRVKKTVFVLGNTPRKVQSGRLTDKGYIEQYFNINTLDSNQVLVNNRLYYIDAKGVHSLSNGPLEPLTESTFAQRKGQQLVIVDRRGKPVNSKSYLLVDSIAFKVEGVPVVKRLSRAYAPIASAYLSNEGFVFIYPDFSKPLPRHIHDNLDPDDPTAEELIEGLWTIASVPDSDYFVFMSYRNGKRFFRFLDTRGDWHRALPPTISFTVIQRSGDILWPEKAHYVPKSQVPEGWKIDRISAINKRSMYHITLRQGKTVRQGIWNYEKQQWLISPTYYQVYPMDNAQQWRYQPEHDGFWGLLDDKGKVLIKPAYYALHPDGWVTQHEDGAYISFYLHPSTLKEYREK